MSHDVSTAVDSDAFSAVACILITHAETDGVPTHLGATPGQGNAITNKADTVERVALERVIVETQILINYIITVACQTDLVILQRKLIEQDIIAGTGRNFDSMEIVRSFSYSPCSSSAASRFLRKSV